LSLTASALPVALIQTASSLPVLLFAVPAGAIGDLVDRRRFILGAQLFMLAGSAALGALALGGLATPWSVLALLFAVGAGQAFTSPTWQTLQPELVPAAERSQAIALGAVNQNLARAVGPAIGGALVVAVSVGSVFIINAATFLAVVVVIYRWRGGARPASALPPEHAAEAVRAGGRYVANSPILRAVMVRAFIFMFFASSLWALLPLVARSDLGLGSGGYGLLLGAVGVGAVGGAFALPHLRARCSTDAMVAGASVTLAVVTAALAVLHVAIVSAVVLAVGGLAWIVTLATLNSAFQSSLPGWVKARGMGWYLIVFQGGAAVGSAAMGIAAQQIGLESTLLIAAGALAVSPLGALRYPLRQLEPAELMPAGDWPAPQLVDPEEAATGPVLVQVQYHPQDGRATELAAAISGLRYSRRRTGASSWRLWRELETPACFVESFVVASWEEHLRQHERVTVRDLSRARRVRELTDPQRPPVVSHMIAAGAPHQR
jgi:MFS family permease